MPALLVLFSTFCKVKLAVEPSRVILQACCKHQNQMRAVKVLLPLKAQTFLGGGFSVL